MKMNRCSQVRKNIKSLSPYRLVLNHKKKINFLRIFTDNEVAGTRKICRLFVFNVLLLEVVSQCNFTVKVPPPPINHFIVTFKGRQKEEA